MKTLRHTERYKKMLLMTLIAICVLTTAGCGTASSQGNRNPMPHIQGLELPSYSDNEDIVRHEGYTASYNHTTLCPAWVAWELTEEEANGQLGGNFSFSRDPQVASPKASREDYSNSGWDKGHMAPRADMKWSMKAMEESYYFTNICPQNHTMNAGAWRKVEELTRRIARQYGTVWVVCGPVYDGDTTQHIGPACIHVPDAFFKALAVWDGEQWQTVGFLIENNPQERSPRHYAVTVDSVEAVIGRNLFPLIGEESERIVEWGIWSK